MSESRWTDLEPEPGDFDTELATINPRFVHAHHGHPDTTVRIVVSIEGEDATRLQRVSAARGETPSQLITQLLREADHSPG
jgi:hypothetical protein